jgi:hypothetical protein
MDKNRTVLRVAVVGLLATSSALAATATVPAQAGTGTSAPALPVPLSVQGNRIVDATGATVVLRGVQRDGTEGGPASSPVPVTSSELGWIGFQQPGSWHSTMVRIPLGSAQWTGACPKLASNPAAYKAAIDAEVQALTAQGIVSLIDLHTSTAGCTAIARHAMPDAPVSQQFWSDVANRYKSNYLVAFELYNEPHYVTDATWLNGTTSATVQDCDVTAPQQLAQQKLALASCQAAKPRYQAAGMQQLYDIVTAAAPGHLVVVNGPAWAANPSTQRVVPSAPNLVYALHPYICPTPGGACNTTQKAVANLTVLDRWLSTASDTPVLVTEMGWPTYPNSDGTGYIDGSRYYRQTLDYLEQQSPPWGFVAFAFDGSWKDAFSLITSTTTYTPNSTGQPVFDLLRSRA